MTRADLYRRYADVIEMCEGKNVEPWSCVKIDREVLESQPTFTWPPDNYTFAVAIVEGQPVFIGDVLYRKAVRRFRAANRRIRTTPMTTSRSCGGLPSGESTLQRLNLMGAVFG